MSSRLPLMMLPVLAILVCSPAAYSADAAGDWPCWRGPNHDGKSADTGLLKQWPAEGPPKLWQVTGIGEGFSSVTVSNSTVYITGQVGDNLVLSTFDLAGKLKWKQPLDKAWTKNHPGSRGSVAIDGGKAYFLSGNGLLGCLDAGAGKPIWSASAGKMGGSPGGWGYAETPLILGDLVIFKPGGKNCIVALNKATGAPVWASGGFSAGPEYSSCTPFSFGGVDMIATGTNAGIVGVSAKTGRLLWMNGFSARNTANCPTPAYADGHVFWANGYGKGGICLKLSVEGQSVKAAEAWKTGDMVCHHGGYVIDQGLIYGNNGGGWACLDLRNGQVKWNDKGVGKGSVVWADGMLYLFSESAGLAGLATCSPAGLEMKGTFRVAGKGPSWAHPVVTGGRLYLRYDDNLYCFDVKAK
jgi:outer membrane protein assembly factor BamB